MSEVSNVIVRKSKAKVKPKPLHIWFHIRGIYVRTLLITLATQMLGFGFTIFCLQTKRPDFMIYGLWIITGSGLIFIIGILCVIHKILKLKRFYKRIR